MYATMPGTCCFQILSESDLGSPDLLLYVHGVHGHDCWTWWQLLLLLWLFSVGPEVLNAAVHVS